jgi:hypothetical protein
MPVTPVLAGLGKRRSWADGAACVRLGVVHTDVGFEFAAATQHDDHVAYAEPQGG